jgi:cytochrome c
MRLPLGGLAGALLLIAAGTSAQAAGAPQGDPARGAEIYERCRACHSPDVDLVGPHHRGVIGRKAGSVADFDYSPALAAAGFVWTEALVDRWLTDPQALVPGQRMNFRVTDPHDRADIIAFLKTLIP